MNLIVERIRRHLADTESNHRRVAISFIWVGFFALSSRLAGAAKEIGVAWRYGVSETVDAYVFVYSLINWPVTVWFSVLTVVLVPLATKARHELNAELSRFKRELFGFTLLLGAALAVVFWISLPTLLRSGQAGLSGNELKVALSMVRPLTFLLPIGLLVGLSSTWLIANGTHRNTLFEAVPSITILCALLLPPGLVPEPLVWGSIVGVALQLSALNWSRHDTRALNKPSFSLRSCLWPVFRGALGLMALGQILMSFTSLIDQFFAAHLASGALSLLNYANRILSLVLSLLAISVARAILPVLADARAKGHTNVDSFGVRWATWIFLLGILLCVTLWLFAPWVVALLFERGAFTARDTGDVASLLRYSAFQIPFFGFSVAMAQVLTSDQRWNVLLGSGALGICTKTISAYFLTASFGVKGLVLSTAFVYFVNSVYFLLAIKWKKIK